MRIDVITLFPEMFLPTLEVGMTKRALLQRAISVFPQNPRIFSKSKHHSVDDAPYGGGFGMVMSPEPLVLALESIESSFGPGHRIMFTPAGSLLTQKKVKSLSTKDHLVLVCGRYEGIDERVSEYIDEEISLGDFVLSGGELAALVLIDGIARLKEGVLHNSASAAADSFEDGLLEYPQYTRPRSFRGKDVPEVLLSGDHESIRRWRRKESLRRTKLRRPDLIEKAELTEEDKAVLLEVSLSKTE